jgi:hypothetical protein
MFQDLRNEQPQPSGAHDGDPGSGRNEHLLEDLGGRSKRLGEYSRFIGNVGRDFMEVRNGQGNEFAKCSGTIDNTQHGALPAVPAKAAAAKVAASAGDVDLAHHALADPVVLFALHDMSYKLVPWNTAKSRVAPEDLPVRAAYACQHHTNQRFTGSRLRSVNFA